MRTYTEQELKKEVLVNIKGALEPHDKEIQEFYVNVVANLIHQTVDQELSLLTEKYNALLELQRSTATVNFTVLCEKNQAEERLSKMELMYEKLANIHSKQEDKYNKLKEAFEELQILSLHQDQFDYWEVKAGLKEQ